MRIGIRDQITKEQRAEMERTGAVVASDGRTINEIIAGAPAPVRVPVIEDVADESEIPQLRGRDLMMARARIGGLLPGEDAEPAPRGLQTAAGLLGYGRTLKKDGAR